MSIERTLINKLITARLSNQPLSLDEALPLTPAHAFSGYRIQAAIADALNWFDDRGPMLWKLGGARGESSAAALGLSALTHHPAGQPLRLSAQDACTFTGLELELAVRLNKPLLPGSTLPEAIAAIGETYLALEVCDQRAEQWASLPALFRLADHQMNRRLVLLGEPLSGWQASLVNIAPSIHQGSILISDGLLSHPQGHPLAALPWLANLSQAIYGQPLAEGTVIATGTWAGLQTLTETTPFSATLDAFSPVEVSLHTDAEAI